MTLPNNYWMFVLVLVTVPALVHASGLVAGLALGMVAGLALGLGPGRASGIDLDVVEFGRRLV